MKSAYGLKIPAPDAALTHVGPGTPGGELMRRYWHPVCLSDELKDLPKRIRLLGEDLVAFRDRSGRAGLLFYLCSHRATSLEYGRIEDNGLRCCYHGWLYDVEGNVLDMPLEPAASTYKNRIKHPCYPVHEFAGVVFAFMGPLDKIPPFPKYDVWMKEGVKLKGSMGPRVGGSVNCNWLQTQENLMDILHTMWLHTAHSGPQFPAEIYGTMPDKIDYEETDLGMRASMIRSLPDGRKWKVVWEVVMPLTTFLLYTDAPKINGPDIDRARAVYFCIPTDDTHQWHCAIDAIPEGQSGSDEGRMKLGPNARKDKSYEYTQRHPDDKEATEGQGPIAIHGLEHLATSDRGVIMFRKILREGIEAVRKGQDPKGVIRDPEKAACVATSATSIISAEILWPSNTSGQDPHTTRHQTPSQGS